MPQLLRISNGISTVSPTYAEPLPSANTGVSLAVTVTLKVAVEPLYVTVIVFLPAEVNAVGVQV